MKSNTVLLLTACVNPNGMKYTVLQDKDERKKQYINAVNYYLNNTKFNIVFCENSGDDLSDFEQFKSTHRIELLSFDGNNYDQNLGKGYGEFQIIQYALKHSVFIKYSSNIIKVTGRLVVEDLYTVKCLKNKLFWNYKHFVFVIDVPTQDNFCNSRCFYADKDFFLRCFMNRSNIINDSEGYYFEHYLGDRIFGLPDYYVVSEFILPISIIGVSGSTGNVIGGKIEALTKYEKLVLIRNYCNINKYKYKNINTKIFRRLSVVSMMVRVEKAFIYRLCRK